MRSQRGPDGHGRGGRKRGVTASSLISEINRAAVDSGVSQIHSRMRSPGEDELKMDVQRL